MDIWLGPHAATDQMISRRRPTLTIHASAALRRQALDTNDDPELLIVAAPVSSLDAVNEYVNERVDMCIPNALYSAEEGVSGP